MTNKIIEYLNKSKSRLIDKLAKTIKGHKFRYETFGKEIEDHFLDEVLLILKEGGFVNKEVGYKKAKDKNEFPDLTILTDINLAIEIKSGNHFKKSGDKWVRCNNSENDMGTLNKWPDKLKTFNGKNIYYFFIEYAFSDSEQKIINVKIDNFYKFLGLNRDGLLKYREKDGNLRPKDFNASSPILSFKQFTALLPETIIYRSKRIIKKHFQYIPKKIRESLLRDLGNSSYNP